MNKRISFFIIFVAVFGLTIPVMKNQMKQKNEVQFEKEYKENQDEINKDSDYEKPEVDENYEDEEEGKGSEEEQETEELEESRVEEEHTKVLEKISEESNQDMQNAIQEEISMDITLQEIPEEVSDIFDSVACDNFLAVLKEFLFQNGIQDVTTVAILPDYVTQEGSIIYRAVCNNDPTYELQVIYYTKYQAFAVNRISPNSEGMEKESLPEEDTDGS